MLGLLVAASFWLAYFDFFPLRLQQLLAEQRGPAQIALARDVYTYLHLPMVAGIVLFAFAMESDARARRRRARHDPGIRPLRRPGLYLLAYVGLRLRVSRTLSRGRLVAAIACMALFPVALAVPALLALALVAAVWVVLHAYEIIWWREARAEARALRLPA